MKRLGLTPEENEASRSLTQAGEDNLANLKTLKGKEFDKAYAGHEVAWHQNVLATFDTTVLPEVRNADFRSLLESVRAVLAEHLDHARALADSLSR